MTDACSPTDPCNATNDGKQTSKVFLFLSDPVGTLAAGYTHIEVERSRDHGVTWVRVTNERTHIIIESDKFNYVYVTEATPATLFRPVIADAAGIKPDVPQAAREANDTSYEALFTIDELKAIYLTGVDLTDDKGTPFPDEMFAHGIRTGIDRCEHELDVWAVPTKLVERYDFWRRDYENFMFIQLRSRPVISVEEVFIDYPSGETVLNFPKEWFRVDRHAGEFRAVPARGTFSQMLIGSGGGFLPTVMGGNEMIPDMIQVTYFAGFDLGVKTSRNQHGIPTTIKDLIGKWACFGPLDVAGDLTGGAAIASKSLSIDGLSTSVNTTSSPMYAGYGARLNRFDEEIKKALPMLKKFYKGARMTVG